MQNSSKSLGLPRGRSSRRCRRRRRRSAFRFLVVLEVARFRHANHVDVLKPFKFQTSNIKTVLKIQTSKKPVLKFLSTCFRLAGLSSFSKAISWTSVELLKPGWMTMFDMLNSSRRVTRFRRFVTKISTNPSRSEIAKSWHSLPSWRSGSAVVLTSYSPSRTFRMSSIELTNGRLKNVEFIQK